MGKIDLGKAIQVEVCGSCRQDPAFAAKSIQSIAAVFKLWHASGSGLPEKQLRSAPIFRFRFPGVHDGGDSGSMFIQDIRAILKEVADDQVEMPVAVDVGLRGGMRKPPLGVLSRFRSEQFLWLERKIPQLLVWLGNNMSPDSVVILYIVRSIVCRRGAGPVLSNHRLPHEQNRGSAPIVNQDVDIPVFVEVADNRSRG